MLYPDLFPETTRYCYVRTDARESDPLNYEPVSYTHLTLPTTPYV